MAKSEPEPGEKDMLYSPQSEREQESFQGRPVESSEAVKDADVDADQVQLLPGTGGPDDVGEVEVDPEDIHLEVEPGPATETSGWTDR
jgi:hypothetical protein